MRIWVEGTAVVGTGGAEIAGAVPFDIGEDSEGAALVASLPEGRVAHWDGASWWTEGASAADTLLSLLVPDANALSATDAQALAIAGYYPEWDASAAYEAGTRARHGGALWRCLQTHQAQAGWEPGLAPSLWARVLAGGAGDGVPEWVQPDSTNGYAKGDRVSYKGAVYASLIDDNVWSPEAYPAGWEAI